MSAPDHLADGEGAPVARAELKPRGAPLPQPTARRLRVYAFDPHAALDLGSSKFSHATISLAWSDPTEEELQPGPVNEYLEVIDVDPPSRQFYEPVDLNAPEILAQDGLPPSEGDPRFHQQMVFAVAMKTIKQFERALGRKILWAPTWNKDKATYEPTKRLRIYPHALREANAYYSRAKKALLFGYFNTTNRSAGANWIFTALSHDIIVHETTHAILDGLHPRYAEPTSEDSLAFHEAFADIAALFAHFQLYEAVHQFIARNGGDLKQSNLLSSLAGQFAKGTTGRHSLRDFIEKDADPDLLAEVSQPHDRGAILVAAVFDAFLSIYNARTADLLRLSGIRLGTGEYLHPDLIARLAQEACKSADHVLRMCIRALDYLPPVDVRFGEFLRAVITADADLIPDDRLNYRLAFVEAFRRRGIFPEHCLSMSPDNLMWEMQPQEPGPDLLCVKDIDDEGLNLMPQYGRNDIIHTSEINRRKVWYWLQQPEMKLRNGGKADRDRFAKLLARIRAFFADDEKISVVEINHFMDHIHEELLWLGVSEADIQSCRGKLGVLKKHIERWDAMLAMLLFDAPAVIAPCREQQDGRHGPSTERRWEDALGLFFRRRPDQPLHTIGGLEESLPVEVASVRTTRRSGPDGQDIRQLVIEVTQRRQGYLDKATQLRNDAVPAPPNDPYWGDFVFRGGATMIIDLRDGKLRYVISKRIDDAERLEEQRALLTTDGGFSFTYTRGRSGEPFAMLHRG